MNRSQSARSVSSLKPRHKVLGMPCPTLQLCLLLSLGFLLLTEAAVLYVKPTEETKCPGDPCHTLDEYASNATHPNDTIMKFLPGIHDLNRPFPFTHASNITLKTTDVTWNQTVVSCSAGIESVCPYLAFHHTSDVTIVGLSFVNCGGSLRPYSLFFLKSNNITISQVLISSNITYPRLLACDIFLGNVTNVSISQSAVASHNVNADTAVAALCVGSVNRIVVSQTNLSLPAAALGESNRGIYIHGVCGSSVFEQIKVNGGYNAIVVHCNASSSVDFTIRNSSFKRNPNTVIRVIPVAVQPGVDVEVMMENLVFDNLSGAALDLIKPTEATGTVTATLTSIVFANIKQTVYPPYLGYIVGAQGVQNVTFIDCEFRDNFGTAVNAMDNTNLYFWGTLIFRNNSAYEGGAIRFSGHSYLYVAEDTIVIFEGNTAENVGGAVFVNQDNIYCFIRAHTSSECGCDCIPRFNFTFINNTARNGGDAIYGAGFTHQCEVANGCNGREVVHSWRFTFDPDFSDPSLVASNSTKVCLCNDSDIIDCQIRTIYPHYYPGEEFPISVVSAGDMDGIVSGAVFAQFHPQHNQASLKECQHYQQVTRNGCTELHYSVFSDPGVAVMTLFPGQYDIYSGYSGFDIIITFRHCPMGFMPSSPPNSQCICDTRLQTMDITCNINDQTIHRRGTVWVSNDTNGMIVYKHCPFGYCKTEEVNVSLEYPDTQCAFNHSGILCGACKPGLSLALGSPQCLSHCSNSYISLLLPFTLAGFVLVFFIKILNLTVAKGTINGLIFYANIVRAGQNTFLPVGSTNPLTIFIAWLNLDLGIETCFYCGLTGYWKTWLQFAFPFYILAIIILIIILCDKFQAVARIFGSNSVPVLATLILLSYSKLLRTIITTLSFSILDLPNGSKTVWSFDGNIPYLGLKHAPLFLFALGVLLFLWLPFTVLLLFEQCFQRIEAYTVRKWMLRLKPFFDAYFGPLRGNHRYWVGVLLVARGILLLVFGLNFTNDPSVNLLAVNTVVLLLLMYTASVPHGNVHDLSYSNNQVKFWGGSCYKSWFLSFLENSFLFNLLLFAIATFYVSLAEGRQTVVAYTSLSITSCQFLGIVIFHVYVPIKKLQEKRQQEGEDRVNRQDYEPIQEHTEGAGSKNWPLDSSSNQDMNQLRESLLEYEDN